MKALRLVTDAISYLTPSNVTCMPPMPTAFAGKHDEQVTSGSSRVTETPESAVSLPALAVLKPGELAIAPIVTSEPNARTVEALNRLVVPAGVFVKIKA